MTLYAAETWTYYKKEDIRRLKALEMWVWRKMEKLSWRDSKQMKRCYKWYRKKEVL